MSLRPGRLWLILLLFGGGVVGCRTRTPSPTSPPPPPQASEPEPFEDPAEELVPAEVVQPPLPGHEWANAPLPAAEVDPVDERRARYLFATYRRWTRLQHSPHTSRGHGSFRAVRFANGLAAQRFAPDGEQYAPFTGFAQEGWRAGVRRVVWFMEKRRTGSAKESADWWFATVDARGNVQRAGKVEVCMDCHRGAANDFVFAAPVRK